jgi:hypothetical protein
MSGSDPIEIFKRRKASVNPTPLRKTALIIENESLG